MQRETSESVEVRAHDLSTKHVSCASETRPHLLLPIDRQTPLLSTATDGHIS